MLKKIVQSSILITSGVLLGRISGFIREVFVASAFGTTNLADVAVLLLSLPDLLLNILVGGALSAALIPSFVANPDRARELVFQASVALFALFAAITCFLSFNSDWLLRLLAPGFSGETAQLAQSGMVIALMLLPLSVVTGVTTAYLQSKNQFFLPSLGTLIFNGCLIAGLGYMLLADSPSLSLLLLSLIGAGVCRYLSQLIAVRPSWSVRAAFRESVLSRDLVKRFFQAMLSGGLLLTFPVIARSFVSYQKVGSVALFNYSMRLIELPLLISITFISIVLLPRLSASYTTNQDLYRKLVVYGFQLVFALGSCVAAVLIAGVVPYTDLVFGRSLSPEELEQVYPLVRIGLLSIVFQGIASFATTVCNAEKNTHRPMYVTLIGAVLFVGSLVYVQDSLTTERIMYALLCGYAALALMLLVAAKLDAACYSFILRGVPFYIGVAAVALTGFWSVAQLAVVYSQSQWMIFPMLVVGIGMLCILCCLHFKTRELLKRKVFNIV